MDSSQASGAWRPRLIHHPTHHHPLFLCPHAHTHPHHLLHPHHHLHVHFSPQCPLHSYLLQPNSQPHACPNSLPLPNQSNLQVPACGETYPSEDLMMQEGNEEVVEEDEEEPVFVLTDEWREFFAKSEAKRRLAKKQVRKKGKV